MIKSTLTKQGSATVPEITQSTETLILLIFLYKGGGMVPLYLL